MRTDRAVEQRLADAEERFRIGQVTAVVDPQVTVVTAAGAEVTLPRLAGWTPVIDDVVLIAITPAGWIVLGAIAT